MARRKAQENVESVEDAVTKRVKQYACCSASISSAETHDVLALVEAAKTLLNERAAIVLSTAAVEPILLQFSLDTTPVSTCQRVSRKHGDLHVKRAAKTQHDYLVCQLFVTVRADSGGYNQTMVFRDPVRLQHGKTMRALASCAVDSPGMRVCASQPGRICVRHQVHDRGITQSFTHAMSGFWFSRACEAVSTAGTASEDVVALHELHTHVGCCAHDAHNSLKWAHQAVFNDKLLLESVYIGIAACRAAYFNAVDILGTWLVEKLQPWPGPLLPDANAMELLWTSLGVDADNAKVLANFRLLWQEDRLLICQEAQSQTDWLEQVSCALLGAWRFQRFTESRWCTVGSSCRALATGFLLGYMSLLQYTHEKGILGEYEWNGCRRIGASERHFVVVVGMAAFLPETFLLHVLKDSRVAKTQEALHEVLFEELSFLDNLPAAVWDYLSQAASARPETLRSAVIQGALVSWAFLEWRVLAVATSLPWSLCAGDIAQNLQDLLSQQECPSEPVSEKLYLLGQAGYNRHRLTEAVRLLGECSWTSAFTEKQHASTSRVRRHHPELGDNMLMARAFCHTFAQMLPGLSEEDRNRAALVSQLVKTLKANPNYITGRQVFLRYIMQKASTLETSLGVGSRYKRPRIMKLHGVHWEKLTAAAKRAYEQEAEAERASKQQRRTEDLATLRQELASLRAEAGKSKDPQGSMLISCCALDKASLQRLGSLMQEGSFKGKQLQKVRERCLDCPKPLLSAEMAKLEAVSQLPVRNLKALPDIAKQLCQMRDSFREAVFCVTQEGTDRWMRFLFASQNPFAVFFQDLDVETVEHRSASVGSGWAEQWSAVHLWQWRLRIGQFLTGSVLEDTDPSKVSVVMRSWFAADGRLLSHDVLQPLLPMLKALAPEQAREPEVLPPATARRRAAEPSLVEKHPWLAAVTSLKEPQERSDREELPDDAAEDSLGDKASEDDGLEGASGQDGDYDELFTALENQRCVLRGDVTAHSDMFRTSLLGGQWQVERTGRTIYGVRVDAKPGTTAAELCAAFKLTKSASFERSVYGEEGGSFLSKLWIHRMSFLCAAWEETGKAKKGLSQQDLSKYELPAEMEAKMQALEGKSLARARGILKIEACA